MHPPSTSTDRAAERGGTSGLAPQDRSRHPVAMDLDTLLQHYFGTTELDTLDAGAFDYGVERLGTAFGTEKDPGRRFALWSLLHTLGAAPEPHLAFKDPKERRAAELYVRATARTGGGEA